MATNEEEQKVVLRYSASFVAHFFVIYLYTSEVGFRTIHTLYRLTVPYSLRPSEKSIIMPERALELFCRLDR